MLMGTALEIEVEARDRAAALAASEKAVAALEAAEARLSTWRDDTELARLNRAPVGERVPLSAHLAADLAAARHWSQETGGTFDPAVGPLVKAWGLRQGGRLPSSEERAAAVAASKMDGLQLEAGTAMRRRADLVLEEGAWGKGAGLADAVAALASDRAVTRAILDLGGQVALYSRAARGARAPWAVPVADPLRRDRPMVELTVDGGSISTSGDSERGIVAGGHKLGHHLDPRTGDPAPSFGSVTVWTENALDADCLSTGLYVMGPEAAMAWAAGHPGIEVLVLRTRAGSQETGLEALATPGLAGRLKALDPAVHIHFWSNRRQR
jgi:thiamine biosynthesis lipoprotein